MGSPIPSTRCTHQYHMGSGCRNGPSFTRNRALLSCDIFQSGHLVGVTGSTTAAIRSRRRQQPALFGRLRVFCNSQYKPTKWRYGKKVGCVQKSLIKAHKTGEAASSCWFRLTQAAAIHLGRFAKKTGQIQSQVIASIADWRRLIRT